MQFPEELAQAQHKNHCDVTEQLQFTLIPINNFPLSTL